MILGSYPCCGAPLMLELPDAQLPRFGRHECEECGTAIWTWITRINPMSWTEDEFLANFDVDPETKSIKCKPGCEFDVYSGFYKRADELGLPTKAEDADV